MSSGSSPGLLILILLEVLSLLNLSLLLHRKVLEQLCKEALGFGLLFPLLNLVFSALNLFRQSFVFFEVEIEDVKFVHKKNSALYSRPEISDSTQIFFVQICSLMGVCGYKQI